MIFKCSMCSYSCKLIKKLIDHYHNEHETNRNFKITCLFSDKCVKQFNSLRGCLKHCRKKHGSLYGMAKKGNNCARFQDELNDANILPVQHRPIQVDFNEDAENLEISVPHEKQNSIKQHLINFTLRAQHDFGININACNYIMRELAFISENSFDLGASSSVDNYNYIAAQCLGLSERHKREKHYKILPTFIPTTTFEIDSKKNKIFCVKYLNHCKKVTNPNEANIRELFKIDRSKLIFAQYYDKDFSSYIDIEWNEVMELVDANELKIKEEVYCGEPQSMPTSESVELSRSATVILDQCNSVILEELLGCSQKASSSQLKRQNAFQEELDVCTIDVSEDREESSTSTTPKKQKLNPPIRSSPRKKTTSAYDYHPTTYVLPEISENSRLGMALQKKKPLTKGLKSLFLTKIYDSFVLKKKFYVEQGYDEIVHAILNAYPYLGGPLPYESAKHLWLKSLNNKFCNERKRIDCKEEINRFKAERILQKSFNVPGEGSSKFGIPCYHPKDGIKDQISVDSHKKWMSQEINLADRNMFGITSRMDITFPDRRNLLFAKDNGAPTNILVGDILREYPCLGIEDQAIGEIRRMFGDDNEKFKKYASRIVSFSQKLNEAVQSSKSKYKTYMNELFCSGNSCNNENFIMYKCLGNMSILLLENPEHVISKSLNESRAPFLNVTPEEQVNLAVDGTEFIRRVSPRNSVFLWLAAFFIFDVRPVNNKRTFDVLQHLIFNIPEKPKFSQTALKIVEFWSSSN